MIEHKNPDQERYLTSRIGKSRIHWGISLFDLYLKRKALGQSIPLLASFKLTYRCNLKCNACPFHQRANEAGSHMSWDRAIKVLQELKRCSCRIVVFEGGEPLLWKDGSHDLNELVEYAKRHFLSIAVTTNGTFPLDVGANVLWVSLDGLKQTHDRLRSESFDRVWANLKVTTHPKILVHFTMNKENWREMDEVVERLKEVPAVKGITVQLFYPYGQGEEPLALSPSERKAAIEKVIHLKRLGYPIINSKNRLRAMIENKWVCHDDMLINVEPDGKITTGCYVKGRGEVNCKDCGFTPVAEASGALDLVPGSILAGWRAFI
ncbi:MAG: radical SAM protein [Deltaproteobacteria bacterium]|nr:radical SAM protein [Deltaproteobacteria bacterium]